MGGSQYTEMHVATKVVFTSSATKVLTGIFIGFVPHTGGGGTGVLLIAHWTEPQKNGASEETLCPPRADGSIKQEGHVEPRPHRFQFLQQEDLDPGADSDAQRHPQLPSRAGGDPSQKNDFQRHLKLPSAKLFEVTNDVWSVSGEFMCRHLTLPSRSAVRAQ